MNKVYSFYKWSNDLVGVIDKVYILLRKVKRWKEREIGFNCCLNLICVF